MTTEVLDKSLPPFLIGLLGLYIFGATQPLNEFHLWALYLSWFAVSLNGLTIIGWFGFVLARWQVSRARRDRAKGPLEADVKRVCNPFTSFWLLNGIILLGFGWALVAAAAWIIAHPEFHAVSGILRNWSRETGWPLVSGIHLSGHVLWWTGVVFCAWPFLRWVRQGRSWRRLRRPGILKRRNKDRDPFDDIRGDK